MITISNLSKSFGKLKVLDALNLTIDDSKVTAILGPNGAGKTTLIKCVLGLVKPDQGSIDVNANRINGDSAYRNDIGYMPQIARYPENLQVNEILDMIRDLRNNPQNQDTELLEAFGMASEMEKAFKNLSGGNRQKVSALLAMLFQPKILFLDEPTAGLDPVSSSVLKDKIARERDRGTTIVLTSHIMSEIQELADEIVYLLDGRIYFRKTVAQILEETGMATLERGIAELIKQQKNAA